MSDRLAEIESIVALAPNDPFPRYGLAMEHRKLGDRPSARRVFDELMERNPDYIPQYLMHGQLLIEMGEREAARRVLTAGIERAERARNFHALGELRSTLASLDDADEDD